jgi:hypothetical protein
MKKWLQKYRFPAYAALISVTVVGILGYLEYNRKLPDLKGLKPAFTLTSADLIRAFETDENKATAKYADEIISIHGIIGGIELTDSGATARLEVEDSMASVACHFEKNAMPGNPAPVKGDSINVKGVCSGYLMDVIMIRCVIENNKK